MLVVIMHPRLWVAGRSRLSCHGLRIVLYESQAGYVLSGSVETHLQK